MNIEQWRTIPQNTAYQVSNWGRVRNEDGKILKPNDNGHGYLKIQMWNHGERTTEYIHRLVAQAFIPNPKRKPEVNHISCIRSENHVGNLEWVSEYENVCHKLLSRFIRFESTFQMPEAA